ncbi:Na+-driven multidrug efflux pump, MATE family [Cupriavidus gilardii CR3]|uniref:MATE family efflux transporter n=1 Tax=Cupriavidus gilardii TaxID=82541 RepID=A0A849BBN0_9BURK|nr:MATE family efflux transporter [Cupriavidus gilardii]ALD90957.1 Na+-driven multidrug efflux pump, MATE family [Cupriavidus gilardii CR3]QQE06003.1 MATE family efflux transporter [Cupriavidus sp. ISTL7]KAB0596234.1 MATE family efflux transporter [Cupriavidus gilardii]MCT9012124.1 MATE family efflux transporter [Cupriavidus gilardii]MCT9053739.1 MATE family efflux transporter [Cupriavidus gilardii]
MTLTQDLRRIAALAGPVLVGQLAVIAFSVIDTIMAGRASATDLAAVGLGGSIYVTVYISLMGVLQALAPIAGQLYGAGRHAEIGVEVRQAAWLGLALAVPGMLLLSFPGPLLAFAKAPPELVDKATAYLHLQAFGLPAALGFRIYSALNNALSRPIMVTLLQLLGLAVKVPLNAWFIHGGLGLAPMGGPGCALASTLISWMWCLSGVLILRHGSAYRPLAIFAAWSWPMRSHLWALLRLGVPMGLTYLIEITSFTLMSVFITRLGTVTLAGHQIIANLGAVAYMLPLSLGIATSTLVAQAVGARDRAGARRVGWRGIRLAAALALAVGATLWLLRAPVLRAYASDAAVVQAALPLVTFVALYQAFDAVQVTTAFVLRAYKIALVPTVIYAVSLWGIGLGGGYVLGFGLIEGMPAFTHGAAGFWLANSLSLAVAGALLVFYFIRISEERS